ncbi:MAG: hypothetical protein AAFP69_06230, partial [Planctomycetota bacterium]
RMQGTLYVRDRAGGGGTEFEVILQNVQLVNLENHEQTRQPKRKKPGQHDHAPIQDDCSGGQPTNQHR